jgi:hypothetical protein
MNLILPLLLTALLFASGPVLAKTPLLKPAHERAMLKTLGLKSVDDLPTYSLDLSLSDTDGRFAGRGTLRWTNTTGAPQDVLPFLLHPNAPAELGAPQAGALEFTQVKVVQGPPGFLTPIRPTLAEVQFERPIAPGEVVVLELVFSGSLRQLDASANDMWAQAMDSMGSMGSPVGGSDYGLLAQGDGLVTVASAVPLVAPFRDGKPLIDEPSGIGDLAWNDPLTFEVRIVTPVGLQVVTNLADGETRALDGQTQVLTAAGAGVHDLVLVASRDWAMKEATVDGITVRSWSLARDQVAGEQVLGDAAGSLAFFQDRYGSYPFTELDVAEASLVGGAGGVEFSAMVLIAGFLYKEPNAATDPLAMLGAMGLDGGLDMGADLGEQRQFVVAHEVAHQWSPGLVGTDVRRSPVVDEPLAQYLAGRFVQSLIGDEKGAAVRDRNVMLNYVAMRTLGGRDGAADRPTDTFRSTVEYAGLVYGKAPYLYVALEKDLGQDRLDKAIRGAIDRLSWTVVTGDEWLQALQKSGARGAVPAGRRWWNEAWGDADLGVDDEGWLLFELALGPAVAAQFKELMSLTGLTPRDIFAMLGMSLDPGAGPFPQGPSPEDMLDLLGGN